jgi:hypothetical protein
MSISSTSLSPTSTSPRRRPPGLQAKPNSFQGSNPPIQKKKVIASKKAKRNVARRKKSEPKKINVAKISPRQMTSSIPSRQQMAKTLRNKNVINSSDKQKQLSFGGGSAHIFKENTKVITLTRNSLRRNVVTPTPKNLAYKKIVIG